MIAIDLITRLLGVLAVIQAFEYLWVRRVWADSGIWTWAALSHEISSLRFFLNERGFLVLNIVRWMAGVSALSIPSVWSLALLLVIHVFTMIRWLGNYNGGSDSMTSLLLLFTFLAAVWPERLGPICLWYITVQLCFSYFKAGWYKIRRVSWRSGKAVSQFVAAPMYSESPLLNRFLGVRWLGFIAAWVVILFELLFPIAMINQDLALVFMVMGFVFHLGNGYVFGLNRFVWAWAAAYPALYWCAGQGLI